MTTDIDIHRSAKILIEYFGDDAMSVTEQRIASFEALKNKEGAHVWKQIKQALDNILTHTLSCEDFIH